MIKIVASPEADYEKKLFSQALSSFFNMRSGLTNSDLILLKNFFEIKTGISIIEIRPELHFHIYEPNDYFGIHDDNMDSRVFSVGVLLNDNFDGGDFLLYPTDKNITLDKSAGNSYIFPVSIKHEVTKITKGNRYSLIWFLKNTNIKFNSKSII